MARISRVASATLLMLNALVRPVPAFLVRSSLGRATCSSSSSRTLLAGKGFGETPKPAGKPPQEQAKDQTPRKAKSLMPLADAAASKLLVKQGADGTAKFNNPAVGDFQVLDALVEVSSPSRSARLGGRAFTRWFF